MALKGQKQQNLTEQQLHKFKINESTEKWVNILWSWQLKSWDSHQKQKHCLSNLSWKMEHNHCSYSIFDKEYKADMFLAQIILQSK